MASSMTGMGLGEEKYNGSLIQVEIRSVNNRFLEVSCRLPSYLSKLEGEIRELIRQNLHRGKIYVSVTIQGEDNELLDLRINPAMARSVQVLLDELRDAAGISDPLKLEHLLKFSEIFEPQRARDNSEDVWEHIRNAIVKSIADLKIMRDKEGRELAKDIRKRAALISKKCTQIEKEAENNSEQLYKKLKARVSQILEDDVLDPNRMFMEIAYMSDKVDVTEECVRLQSHSKLFNETIDQDKNVGKRLNFLLQEMNREANTISSKASNAEISQMAVEIKEEIEKIREQVQNLE